MYIPIYYISSILKASVALDLKQVIKKFFYDNDYQSLYTLKKNMIQHKK